MLDPGARNGELAVNAPVASWLLLPLVAGHMAALPSAAPSSPAPVIASIGGLSGPGVPSAPTGVTATATDGQAAVDWTAPRMEDGGQINNYLVTSSPPGAAVVVAGGQTSAVIGGLANGVRYAFTVAAADSSGRGPPSTPSNSVTPESLSTFTSTVSIRSVSAMFNGGACVDQGSQCFGIQQNSFVNSADGEYWVQNLVFVEDNVQHGWEAEGNYEIWNGTQQSVLACSGTIVSGPNGQFCQWPTDWRPLKFPTRIKLTSTVADGDVVLKNSLDNSFPAWSPGQGGINFIVDKHEMAVTSLMSLFAPETVIVGETGRHTVTFNGGSGSIASQMVLANGQTGDPDSQCVAQSSDTSTGESSVGFYWSASNQDGTDLVDFAAHGGNPGDGDGVMVLPDTQMCA
jgi:Fibronectin type III domain